MIAKRILIAWSITFVLITDVLFMSCSKIPTVTEDKKPGYFPKEIMNERYSKCLTNIWEPSLYQLSNNKEKTSFRALLLKYPPSDGSNYYISCRVDINPDHTGTFYSTTAKIIRTTELSKKQIDDILDTITKEKFWETVSQKEHPAAVDGLEWLIEGTQQGKYHYLIDTSDSSENKNIRTICRYFFDLQNKYEKDKPWVDKTTAKTITNPAQEANIQETLFRYLFKNNHSDKEQSAQVYFLALTPSYDEGDFYEDDNNQKTTPENSDPNDDFMKRFTGNIPPVKKASQCLTSFENDEVKDKESGEPGLLFYVFHINWVNESEVRVLCSYYKTCLTMQGYECTLKLINNSWQITEANMRLY
jgi:hypothetical protein